jgi:hypothetical protein
MPEKWCIPGKGTFIGVAAIGLVVIIIGVPLVTGRFFSSEKGNPGESNYQLTTEHAIGKSVHRKRFEASIQFSKDSPVMRVAHDVRLDPIVNQSNIRPVTQESDSGTFWAFFVAVKVRHLSGKGGRHIFALKYDAANPFHPGWGVAFHKMGSDVFPEVYWGTARKKGLWYRFMPVAVHAGEWWAVGLSFEKDRYLVLHTQQLYGDLTGNGDSGESGPPSVDQSKGIFRPFRGAYDLMDAGGATSSADLVLGASPGSAFKGGFGFFGVARVSQKSSENWFVEAVRMINNSRRASDIASPNQESGEVPMKNAFKSDNLEFVFGSFDGKQEIVSNQSLP